MSPVFYQIAGGLIITLFIGVLIYLSFRPKTEKPKEYKDLSLLERYVDAGITHVSVLSHRDGNNCESCQEMDKTMNEIPIQEAIEKQLLPNKDCSNEICRCTYLPLIKDGES